jgi:hypothetical protein
MQLKIFFGCVERIQLNFKPKPNLMIKSKLKSILTVSALFALLLVFGAIEGNAQSIGVVSAESIADDPDAEHVSDLNATTNALEAEIASVQDDNSLRAKQKELSTNYYRILIKLLPERSIDYSLHFAGTRTRDAMKNVPYEDRVNIKELQAKAESLIQ